MAETMGKREKWQEIANRGLQDRFDEPTRAKFDEAVRRGLISMPAQDAPIDAEPKKERSIESAAKFLKDFQSKRNENVSGLAKTAGRAITTPVKGIAEVLSGAVGDIGNLTGMDSVRDAGYENRQAFRDIEQKRRDESTSLPMELAGMLVSGGALGRGIGMGSTALRKIATGAGVGGMFGAATPSVSDEEKAIILGASTALGGAIPAVVAGGRGIIDKARNVVDPLLPGGNERVVRTTLQKAAGNQKDQIAALLDENKQLPGGQAGVGEIAAPSGQAEFSALQRQAERVDPSDFIQMNAADNRSRADILRSISGTADDRASGEAARSAGAKVDYGKAFSNDALGQLPPDNELQALSKDPFFKKAAKEAGVIAKSRGIDPKENLTEFLHIVKKSLEGSLEKTGDGALSGIQKDTTSAVRKRVVDWMNTNNPAYSTARENFAMRSAPQDRKEIGKTLYNSLVSSADDVSEEALKTAPDLIMSKQKAGPYSTALRNAAGTLKKSISNPGSDKLEAYLLPEEMAGTQAVKDSLKRRETYEEISSKGASSAEALLKGGSPVPPAIGMFSPAYNVVRSIFSRLAGRVEGKSLELFAEVFKDPAKVAELLRQVPIEDQRFISEGLKEAQKAGIILAPQIAPNLLEGESN